MSRTMVNQLVAANANDVEVFENIFQKYNRYVYNLAYRLSGNADDAKDLTQETFLRVFRSLHTFEKGTSLERWLYRITTNLFIDQTRKRPSFSIESIDKPFLTEEGEIEREIPDLRNSPADLTENNELQTKIQDAINKLSPEFRIAIVLSDVQGLSYEEISQITQISLGTVKSRIHRARRLLRGLLEPYLKTNN